MKILVTSASSFAGRFIAKKLINDGYLVTGTYRRYSKEIGELVEKNKMIGYQINFTLDSSIKLLNESFDIIINCSGAYPNNNHNIEDIISLNVKNSYFIGKQINQQKYLPKRIINFSTLSIYGDLKTSLINDNSLPAPSGIYGSSKLLGEQVLEKVIKNKVPIVNLRLPAILGEGAHTAWLPVMAEKMKANRDITIYNPESFYSSCISLDILYEFTINLIKKEIENKFFKFPIGSKGDITIIQITNFLKEKLKSSSKISVIKNSDPCCRIESNQAQQLGYIFPKTSSCIDYWSNFI